MFGFVILAGFSLRHYANIKAFYNRRKARSVDFFRFWLLLRLSPHFRAWYYIELLFFLSEIEDDVTFPVWGPLKCLISPSLPSIWKINTDETSALSRQKNGDGVFWDDRTEKKLNLDDLFLFGRIQPYTFATMSLFQRNL